MWPLSRQNHPKQFLDLLGCGDSLLQSTIKRAQLCSPVTPLVIANEDHRFLLQHQITPLGLMPADVLLEPCSRNTTGAIVLACLRVMRINPDALILCLPADHYLPDSKKFAEQVAVLADQLPEADIGLFGIKPINSATQYGYIEFKGKGELKTVNQFIEKPNAQMAKALFERTDVAWNSGIVLAKAKAVYDAFLLHTPGVLQQVNQALNNSTSLYDFERVGEPYANIENLAFDVSILERSHNLKMMLLAQQWDDLGSWTSLLARRQSLGLPEFNVFTEGKALVALGAKDIVLVHHDDVLFVADQDALSDMTQISEYLLRHNLQYLVNRIDVHRPWGQFKILAQDEHFIVKRLMVYPKQQISLQSHQYRREHWVVVKGEAEVQLDGNVLKISEGGAISIEQNQKHRLRNPFDGVLEIIEVQTGERLDEKDIIRYDDQYHRHLTEK